MLYGIGIMLLLLSSAFVGGSVAVPVTMAAVGFVLLLIGKKVEHDETE